MAALSKDKRRRGGRVTGVSPPCLRGKVRMKHVRHQRKRASKDLHPVEGRSAFGSASGRATSVMFHCCATGKHECPTARGSLDKNLPRRGSPAISTDQKGHRKRGRKTSEEMGRRHRVITPATNRSSQRQRRSHLKRVLPKGVHHASFAKHHRFSLVCLPCLPPLLLPLSFMSPA